MIYLLSGLITALKYLLDSLVYTVNVIFPIQIIQQGISRDNSLELFEGYFNLIVPD